MEFGAYCTCKLYKYFCNFVTLIWRKNAKYNERVKTLPLTPTWKILREINLIYSWRNHFTVWKSNTMWLRFILKIQHFFRQINVFTKETKELISRNFFLSDSVLSYFSTVHLLHQLIWRKICKTIARQKLLGFLCTYIRDKSIHFVFNITNCRRILTEKWEKRPLLHWIWQKNG